MRSAALAAAVLLLAATPVAAKFHPTHSFVATGQHVDHWTADDPEDCGPVGDGTVTVDFGTAKPTKVRAVIDPAHGAEGTKRLGSWTLLAPADEFGHLSDVRPRPATGTIALVDNTVPRPPPEGGECATHKEGCGTHALKADATVYVLGYNRRFIRADLFSRFTEFGPCGLGLLEAFDSPSWAVPGTRDGELLIRMPRAAKLRARKVVTVSASDHQRTSYGSFTDDVTRTVTVTFTRLR
jgi:hypothetical protein